LSSSIPDVRKIPDEQRQRMADAVRVAYDFKLPELEYWNYGLCRQHRHGWVEKYYDEATDSDRERTVTDRPAPGCRKCGVFHRRHQRVGATWLYLVKRGLLADPVGTGKTVHGASLIAMIKETGELDEVGRVVVCCRAPALLQWRDELERMIPHIVVDVAMGTRRQRIDRYLSPWDVMLIGPQMLLNDFETLMRFNLGTLIVDDVDALRNRDNRTSYVLKRVAGICDRFVFMSGTPLQKRLEELHSVLEPMGGREIFGSEDAFKRRYVRTEKVRIFTGRGRTGYTEVVKTVGYKNLDEFKQLIQPISLRRNADQIDDVDLPTIIPSTVELDLHPQQRAKYDELKRGVITIMREEGAQVKQATALAKIHYGAQICGGLATLGEQDGPEASVKLDWLMDKLVDGDFEEEKVVVFMSYKASVRAFQARMQQAGVGFETVWGEEPDKAARARSQARFWDDPSCRVLVGTQAIEQSLNLQCARHLVNFDTILNPARMEQLAGRIRRDGSAFKHVYVHNLRCQSTQEERYEGLLEREQALIDYVWDESSELFEKLSPLALLSLIAG